jgi:hypothetical protein
MVKMGLTGEAYDQERLEVELKCILRGMTKDHVKKLRHGVTHELVRVWLKAMKYEEPDKLSWESMT